MARPEMLKSESSHVEVGLSGMLFDYDEDLEIELLTNLKAAARYNADQNDPSRASDKKGKKRKKQPNAHMEMEEDQRMDGELLAVTDQLQVLN